MLAAKLDKFPVS